MEQIVSKDNLNAAYLQVVRNKGATGVDGMNVEELGAYLWENGENIREQLKTRKYKTQPVRRVEIPKPDGGTRKLGVPTVVDRFVQQAVLKALEMMNDGHNWIVDIDLAKFFDTVDHEDVYKRQLDVLVKKYDEVMNRKQAPVWVEYAACLLYTSVWFRTQTVHMQLKKK